MQATCMRSREVVRNLRWGNVWYGTGIILLVNHPCLVRKHLLGTVLAFFLRSAQAQPDLNALKGLLSEQGSTTDAVISASIGRKCLAQMLDIPPCIP